MSKSYILDEYSLVPDQRLLIKNGQPIRLANRPFQVLLYLVEHNNQLVSRAELLDRFWDGKDVYDDTLRKTVGTIRKVLGDASDHPRFIETRWAGGYRYVGPLEEQFVPGEGAIVEVERTRGIKIVVEDGEIYNSAETSESVIDVPALVKTARPVNVPGRKMSRRAMPFVVVGLMIMFTALVSALITRTRSPTLTPPAPIGSIAVMPLKNLSGDPAQEYFSDGLTESLITELSKIKDLKVISRSSVSTLKGNQVDPRQVGQQLGVAAMLEGSVGRSGEDVRIEVRLISTEDGRVLWASDNYDRPADDLFTVQDEIAQAVRSRLRLNLDGSAEQQFNKRYTDNREAYDDYLKGRYYWNKRTGEGIKKAIPYFEQAVALDPHYALAYTGLADCYFLGLWFVPFEPNEATAKAKAAVMRALALDDNLAEAHAGMGSIYFYQWDWAKAEQEDKRALALNPGSAELHHQYSLYLNVMKRPDDAIREGQHARELDPLSLSINTDLGMAYYFARRYDEAIAVYKQSLDLDPGFDEAHYYLAESYVMKGWYQEAFAEYQKTSGTSRGRAFHLIDLGWAYAYSGHTNEARKTLDQLIELSRREHVSPYFIAYLYAALGEKKQSFKWLEQAYKAHAPQLVDLLIDQTFDSMRSDSHFTDLLRRLGLFG
jgi:TolB-like protein/DNA-binding winged helix-turn-helix (wHTH) protein/Tfp pilus assembly protein PilF